MMKTFYIETYGCRMNICDSEVIIAILSNDGYQYTEDISSSDIVILNSCSVREDGHNKIYERLAYFGAEDDIKRKTIVITGCFASLLEQTLFEKYPYVNIIANPNCYRALPTLLDKVGKGDNHLIAVVDDNDELYEDILPIREIEDATTAAINVMKGCNQNCSYCIEPITRGKEHCRSVKSIIGEALDIADKGYKELTLVGHLIDKYKWVEASDGKVYDFAMLLGMVAETCPNLRIKFLSSHPSYLSDNIVQTILDYPNIMHVLHLPIQSASDEVLKRMNRGYTADMFIKRVKRIRSMIPDISIITDIMVGFCGETWKDFQKTVELVKLLKFDDINVFRFSMRSKTIASRIYVDDVCEEEKQKRYEIIKELNDSIKLDKMQELIGKQLYVIVEGKNSLNQSFGRDMNHRTVIIAADDIEINQCVKVVVDSVSPKYLYGHCANRQSCC